MISDSALYYFELVSWVLFAIFSIFACMSILRALSLLGAENALKKIFDDFDFYGKPQPIGVINNKSMLASGLVKKLSQANLSVIFMFVFESIFYALTSLIPFPEDHIFYRYFGSQFFVFIFFSFTLLFIAVHEIGYKINSASQDISFVNYRDINEQDATFLKSFKLSSNYLKNIALSERKITVYELNKLMEIANEIKKDENEKNITSIFKK